MRFELTTLVVIGTDCTGGASGELKLLSGNQSRDGHTDMGTLKSPEEMGAYKLLTLHLTTMSHSLTNTTPLSNFKLKAKKIYVCFRSTDRH